MDNIYIVINILTIKVDFLCIVLWKVITHFITEGTLREINTNSEQSFWLNFHFTALAFIVLTAFQFYPCVMIFSFEIEKQALDRFSNSDSNCLY